MNTTSPSPPKQQLGKILIVPRPDQESIGQTPAPTPMQRNRNIDIEEVVRRLRNLCQMRATTTTNS